MTIVDSSAWLAYFADEPDAQHFANAIEAPDFLTVPSITLIDAFKKVAQQRSEGVALQYVAVIQQGCVVSLDAAVALLVTTLGGHQKMPSTDSIIHATAQQGNTLVWTQDADLEDLKSARYFSQT